ncbi:hypothetical protein QQ045_020978 [Rhodiola kirilowii]
MSSLSRELVFLMLQFLDEEKFKETVHKLEQESGFFFNMKYFEECVTNGEWDEVEKYLSGFTKVDDNRYSMKIFFEIRKQKYLEALDRHDKAKAVEILVKDLKVFSSFNEDLFKEITLLLTLGNFRENEQLSKYGDTKSARAIMLVELKKLIEANPLFREKLQFPTLRSSRLRTLINQSLNWQHQLCKNPKPNPDIKTLFVDHACDQPNGSLAPSQPSNSIMGSIPKVGGFPQLGAHGPFPHAPAPLTASLAGWMASPSSVTHQAVPAGPMGLQISSTPPSLLKHPRTPSSNPAMDYQSADSEHVLKRPRPRAMSDEVNPPNIFPVSYPTQGHPHALHSTEDIPKTVVVSLNQGSTVKSMDFHPIHQTLILVGTNTGDLAVWDVGNRERLASRNFKVWDLRSCSVVLQASLASEYSASVNRVMWSPDGSLFGVAYSKHLVQVFSYPGGEDLRNHLEIDAHVGNVSDLAFSHPNKQLSIITCGEDKIIKVWDAATGAKQYTFEGHEAPVYSVCPHHKENIQFIFSTATDGKIKAWLYDNMGSRVDYDAPGRSCTMMAYSADGTRLFSCGTSKDGESHIVEWNESEGAVKRAYHGLSKRSVGIVQFDTTKNRFLAAGDDHVIKFWDMDKVDLLATVDAEGGLPVSPCLRFSKDGILLAVSTSDNGVKILANSDGVRVLRSIGSRPVDMSKSIVAAAKGPAITTAGASSSTVGTNISIVNKSSPMITAVGQNGDSRSLLGGRIVDDADKSWRPTEINEQSQLRCLKLPDSMLAEKIIRLIYTNSGSAILALAYNAVHKLWKWQRTDRNQPAKATTNVAPLLWQPASGIMMTNETNETNLEEAVPCFALSKNDSYVMSASGGKISLFNMMTFKTMTTFMPPPPAATCLAFHPQDNNIVAIGMEDASVQIYNVRVDEVKSKLKGHEKRVTGLAFSNSLNVLVSSGADAQMCVWSMGAWERLASKHLQIPTGRVLSPLAPTRIQFHQDQLHFLVVHETQLALYKAPELECLKQWYPREATIQITDGVYSSDSQSIYASFDDGTVAVLTSTTLRPKCLINVTGCIPSNPSLKSYPTVVAPHPSEPNQFALGFSDGGVVVMEPLESEGKWGTVPVLENSANHDSASAVGSDQQPAR